MPHSVTISTRSGHSNYGEPAWSTSGSTYRARVVLKPAFLRGRTNEVIEASGFVWIASTANIDLSDRITLPDGTSPPIVGLERYPDEEGTFFHRVTLGYARRILD